MDPESLKEMWLKGAPAKEIAEALGVGMPLHKDATFKCMCPDRTYRVVSVLPLVFEEVRL